MRKLESLKISVLGDTTKISSERYFITLWTFVASFFLMVLCFVQIIMSLKTTPIILAASSSMLMLVLYYFVRFRSCLFYPKIILTVGGLIMLDFSWYSKFLSQGPGLFFILIFAALVIWVWEGKQLMILLTFYFINLLVLFYIDYHATEILFNYPDLKTRSIDIFLSFSLYSFLLILMLYTIKREFQLQKENAIKSDKLKSSFLANMSHEIRTPMNGILGFSELLKEPNLSGDEQKNYIGMIEKSGHRMLNIINDIIDISKIEAGLMKMDIKESNINEQIEYVYTFFKPEIEAKGMKLSFKNALPANASIIKTDREKVFAIFTNLVKNAIKYSNEGEIEFGYTNRIDHLEFFVTDTGIGIPKDRQQAIFERFIQSDIEDIYARQGAGLGLTITKTYVEMLGGKIWLESEEGVGSKFYFTLPYHSESKEKSTAVIDDFPVKELTQTTKLKILIAEDDPTSEKLISLHIKKYCKQLLIATRGNEAVDICRKNPDLDLILMDIQLPILNGYEATRQIRQFNKDVIIIAETAYGLSGDRKKAIEAGCTDYISKPIIKHELHALISKYFNK